jgi:hypothetical protein
MSFPKWSAPKDPDEVLDYLVDWTARLAGDVIISSIWPSPPSGIVIQSNTFTGTKTTVWLTGGTPGTKYTFTNRITTVGGRTQDQSVVLTCKVK